MTSYPSQPRPRSGYPNNDTTSMVGPIQNMQIGNRSSLSSPSGAAPPNLLSHHPDVRPVGPPPSFATGRPLTGAIGNNLRNGSLVMPSGNPSPMSGAKPFARNPSPAVVPSANQVPFSGALMNQEELSNGPLVSRLPPPPPSHQTQHFQTPAVDSSILSSQHPEIRPPPSSSTPFMRDPPTSSLPFTGAVGGELNSQPPFSGGLVSHQIPPDSLNSSALPSSQQFSRIQPPSQHTGSRMLHRPPTIGGSYGPSTWNLQPSQPPPVGISEVNGKMLPPSHTMYDTPTQATVSPMMHHSPVSTPSKADFSKIPRPMPSSSTLIFHTRRGHETNIPPPATSDFIVRDTGNCSPRYMRCTVNQIPCSRDLLSTSAMNLSLLVQPFALPHPSEEPIQVVDFGENGPLRCNHCKGYINPFMKFIDQGRQFICNLCGSNNETPRSYHCNLGPDGRRRDVDERPELCRGAVEFVATKEFMIRDPMPAVFFFLIDVSMKSVQTGATAAACSAISQAIADLPGGSRTMVGIATYDSTIHFYNLRRSLQQPLMLIVPDVQDVYTPLHTDIIVPFIECCQTLQQLLENIPTMFENNLIVESSMVAAMKASCLAMKPTGGKLFVFQSVMPSVGIGSFSSREAEGKTNMLSGEKVADRLLQPVDKTLKTIAIDFAEWQICVDIFISSQTYVDIASICVVPTTTGGQVYYYHPFSALSDSAKLYNDLRWNIARPQGFEAVMRVRCSQGLQVQEYVGNFCKRVPTDIDLPGVDSDKTIMVTFKHDDKFQEGAECAFQCALLYTTVYGQRRIRVTNLSLQCTSNLSNIFRTADLDSQFAIYLKQSANDILTNPLPKVREKITNLCINTLHSYRKYCSTATSSAKSGQLILPEALKLLPLYTLALIKSVGLRTNGRIDDRSHWINRARTLSTALCIPLVYPRMVAIHNIASMEDGLVIPSTLPLSSEHVTDNGIYLLENGEDSLIYVGNSVDVEILQNLFGASTVDAIPSQFILKHYDNELSKKLNDIVNEIRRQRCSYLRLRLCKRGDPSGMLFFSYLIEDKSPGDLSYVEFLVHVHRQIQAKMDL